MVNFGILNSVIIINNIAVITGIAEFCFWETSTKWMELNERKYLPNSLWWTKTFHQLHDVNIYLCIIISILKIKISKVLCLHAPLNKSIYSIYFIA